MQNASLVLAFCFQSVLSLFGKVAPIRLLSQASQLPQGNAFQVWGAGLPVMRLVWALSISRKNTYGQPLLNIGMDSNRSQFMARQRIESQINLPRLFAVIDADPSIVGAGVVYIDADFNVITLREFKPICSIKPKRIILREAQKYISPAQFVEQVKTDPQKGASRRRLLTWAFLQRGSHRLDRSIQWQRRRPLHRRRQCFCGGYWRHGRAGQQCSVRIWRGPYL